MLSKLNYAKDVELQSQRAQMEAMQVRLLLFHFRDEQHFHIIVEISLRLELKRTRPRCSPLRRRRARGLRCDRGRRLRPRGNRAAAEQREFSLLFVALLLIFKPNVYHS